MLSNRLHPVAAFLMGGTLFAAVLILAHHSIDVSSPGLAHGLMKGLLAAAAIGCMLVTRRSLADFGLRRAPDASFWKCLGFGIPIGILSTLLILVTPAKGMPLIASMNLGEIVLSVWLASSLAEELLTRGLVQSLVRGGAPGTGRLTPPIWTSATLFGAMHLTLLAQGVDLWTVSIIVGSTFLLGLVCALLRQRFDSVVPAILAHVGFNVGGLLAGIAYVVATGGPGAG